MKIMFLRIVVLISIFLSASAHSSDEKRRIIKKSESNKVKHKKKKSFINLKFKKPKKQEEDSKEDFSYLKEGIYDMPSSEEEILYLDNLNNIVKTPEEPREIKQDFLEKNQSPRNLIKSKGRIIKVSPTKVSNLSKKILKLTDEDRKILEDGTNEEIITLLTGPERKIEEITIKIMDETYEEDKPKIAREIAKIIRGSFIPEQNIEYTNNANNNKIIDNLKTNDPKTYYRKSKMAEKGLSDLLKNMKGRALPKIPNEENNTNNQEEGKNDENSDTQKPSLLDQITKSRNKLKKTESTTKVQESTSFPISSLLNALAQFGENDSEEENNDWDAESSENSGENAEPKNIESKGKVYQQISYDSNNLGTTIVAKNLVNEKEMKNLSDSLNKRRENLGEDGKDDEDWSSEQK